MITKKQIKLIPVPKKATGTDEQIQVLPYIQCDKSEWKELTVVFCNCINKMYDIMFVEGTGGVCIHFEETLPSEAYRIHVDETVEIYASDYQGAVYGVASVLQLLSKECTIPKLDIEDWPDKEYRGLMVDIARQWHPFRTLLHYVDLCFYLKIKYLHLHFSDDQSYTLPSRTYPKLLTSGRHYTEEEIALLRNYANARGIILIPEIEMPGHAKILNKCYPEVFSDTLLSQEYEKATTENGAAMDASSIICAGNPKAFQGVKDLIDEVLSLFPDSMYIHLGADEANHRVWEQCCQCQQYMKEHHLKDTKELYAEFLGRVTDYVLSRGRTPILWEGFANEQSHFISKDVVVISWENHYQTTNDLLKNGFKIINCAWQPLYVVSGEFDHDRYYVEDIMKWNVYEWQHWWSESAASLNPIHVQPTDQVLGAQIAVWGLTYEREISRTVENLAALSERVWSVERICDKQQFQEKIRGVLPGVFKLIAEQ